MTRTAVVGCGAIALEHLGYLRSSSRTQLVGVCDASPAAAAFARDRFGAGAAFDDLASMIRESAPDVVHVLTPPHTHVDLVSTCLDAGCHVVCEKPAAGTAGEVEQMVGWARAAGKRLIESQNMRWNEPVLDIVRARTAGRLGDIREIDLMLSVEIATSRFGDLNLTGPAVRLPGGAVHDYLPHLSYLFLSLADVHNFDSIAGRLWNRSGNPRVGFDHLDALVTAGDVRGRLRLASDLAPDAFRMVVRGTEASMEIDLFHPYQRVEGGPNVGKRIAIEHVVSGLRLAWSAATDIRDKVLQFGAYHGLARMLEEFYRTLDEGEEQPVTFDQMLESARLVDAIVGLGVA